MVDGWARDNGASLFITVLLVDIGESVFQYSTLKSNVSERNHDNIQTLSMIFKIKRAA